MVPSIGTELQSQHRFGMTFNRTGAAGYGTYSEHSLGLIDNLHNRFRRPLCLCLRQCLTQRVRDLHVIHEE